MSPIAASVSRWTDCSQGDLPIIWPGLLPGRSSSTSHAPADARLVEGELLRVEQRLQPLEALVHHFARAPGRPSPPPACRAAANI